MSSSGNATREVVDYKVRRALRLNALLEIRRLVDKFELEEHLQKRAGMIAVLALMAFLLIAVSVIAWPSIFRYVTGLLS